MEACVGEVRMDIELKEPDGEARIERIDLEQALSSPSILLLDKGEREIATCYRVTLDKPKVSFIVSEGFVMRVAESIKAVDNKTNVEGLTQLFLLLQAKVLASLGAGTPSE